MGKTKNNNMLMHGFILVTILATAKSAEAEITMEAAFQGRCGHTSPCEQLCYEIHDGMYECDCIEGYELNKNGYSCQVINSTGNSDSHSKSDEDVLYQKGASFSAKLANGNEDHDNQLTNNDKDGYSSSMSFGTLNAVSSSSISEEENEDAVIENYYSDNLGRLSAVQEHQKQKVNSNDYYISSESITFNQELLNNGPEVPEFKAKQNSAKVNKNKKAQKEQKQRKQQQQQNIGLTTLKPTKGYFNWKIMPTMKTNGITTTGKPHRQLNQEAIYNGNTNDGGENNDDDNDDSDDNDSDSEKDDYYSYKDMSIYDDVNNNQLNLRTINHDDTYQNQNARNSNSRKQIKKLSNERNNYHNSAHNAITIPTTSVQVDSINDGDTILMNNLNISNILSHAEKLSNACDIDCGPDGLCEHDDDGNFRCLCPFGKTGNNCLEDFKVRVPKFSEKSWLAFPALRGAYKHVQIRVEFRPESFDGIILLSGERDDLTGDFMALLLNKGFIEFWFDCGSGVGNVRSRETIMLNEWNSVIIYRHRWDAWLVLNHGSKVQGRSKGLFSRITFREPVFLGGTGNITGLAKRLPISNGFIGCIRRLVANEHEYKFDEHPLGDVTKGFDILDCVTDKCFKYPCQHGGKCLPSDQGAVCLCPIGFVGDLCEIRMDLQVPAFNGSSFLQYAPLGDSALIWLELKVILKPEHPDGLILYSGSEKQGDFIALSLNNGFVEFTFDLGSGPAVVRGEFPITIGQWHTIRISRTARLAVLKIDRYMEVMTISSNGFWHLSLPEILFVGGVDHSDKLPLDLKYKSYFVGCIQKIDINGHSLAIISEALGGTNIGNCPHACVARPCGPFSECIPQMENYECRCSAINAQCHRAAEVSLDELSLNKGKATSISHSIDSSSTTVVKPVMHHRVTMSEAQLKKMQGYIPGCIPQKVHNKENSRYLHKFARSTEGIYPMEKVVTTTETSTSTTTTAAASTTSKRAQTIATSSPIYVKKFTKKVALNRDDNDKKLLKKTKGKKADVAGEADADGNNDNDDIIFRDVHGMHKRYEHQEQEFSSASTESPPLVQLSNGKPQRNQSSNNGNNSNNSKRKQQYTSSTKHQGKGHYPHSSKPEPHPKHYAGYEFKLSRLPTHYESFQTNPDSDILTFGDNVKVEAHIDDGDIDYEEKLEYEDDMANAWEQGDGFHFKENANAEIEPYANVFAGDDSSIFDDDYRDEKDDKEDNNDNGNKNIDNHNDDSYHRKQVAQALQRVQENLQSHTKNHSKSVSGDYENYDSGEQKHDNDELLKPAETTRMPGHERPKQATDMDWSLLTKLDLSADYKSKIGVRKNFGACFAGENSYFHYNDADTMSKIINYKIDLNLRIKTRSESGIILWTGRQGTTEDNDVFLSLGIEDGYLHMRYDLGSGEVDIKFNTTKVSDGLWHRVRAIRDSQEGFLEVDGRKSLTKRTPGKLRQLNTDTGLYVGGMPDVIYFTRRKYTSGINGCISEIVLAGELKLNFDTNTLGTAHNVETGIL